MGILEGLQLGFSNLLGWQAMALILAGVIMGVMGGAMPGLSPSTAVALLVPFSFTLAPDMALIMLCSIYLASNYGGSITAVLINTPGTPAAAVTAIDGYALTQKGQAGKGLGTALVASTIGGAVGIVILILFAVPLARAALKFSPAAYFALALFGLATVASMGQGNVLKAMIAALFGLLVATIGMDTISGITRFTFGIGPLYDGFRLIPALIGLFAVSVVLAKVENWTGIARVLEKCDNTLPKLKEFFALKWAILRSSVIGTVIGIFPGAGATIASFISYDTSKRLSKTPEEYGQGSLHGVASSEAANSSSVGGALVPLLALGIPGSATDAVLLGAFMMHDLKPGPLLFRDNPDIVYGIFTALIVANLVILLVGLYGNRLFLKVISIPDSIMFTFIMLLAIVGSYSVRGQMVDVYSCIGFGVVGWLFKRYGFPVAPVVLGIVLGGMMEENLRRALIMGGFSIFFEDKLAFTMLMLAAISFFYPFIKGFRSRRRQSAAAG